MSVKENPTVYTTHAFADAWNSNDLSQLRAILAPDFQAEGTGITSPVNAEQFLAINQNFLTAFPGSTYEVLLTITQGDYVVLHWKVSGAHTGVLHSPSGAAIQPTHKTVTVHGSSTSQIRDGKIVKTWNYWDTASLLGQLGLLPPM